MGDRGTGAFLSDKVLGIIAIIAVAAGAFWASNSAAEKAVRLPPPAFDATVATTQETAVFAGGCFWGVQAVFRATPVVPARRPTTISWPSTRPRSPTSSG